MKLLTFQDPSLPAGHVEDTEGSSRIVALNCSTQGVEWIFLG